MKNSNTILIIVTILIVSSASIVFQLKRERQREVSPATFVDNPKRMFVLNQKNVIYSSSDVFVLMPDKIIKLDGMSLRVISDVKLPGNPYTPTIGEENYILVVNKKHQERILTLRDNKMLVIDTETGNVLKSILMPKTQQSDSEQKDAGMPSARLSPYNFAKTPVKNNNNVICIICGDGLAIVDYETGTILALNRRPEWSGYIY